MRNKLMWFYQEVDDPDSIVQPEPTKPGPSRTAVGTSNSSKTPQGDWTFSQQNLFRFVVVVILLSRDWRSINLNCREQWTKLDWIAFEIQFNDIIHFHLHSIDIICCCSALGTTPAGPIHKHKLFLTDGWSCAFTGVCIYIFRINTTKQLPEEGFQKDLWVYSSIVVLSHFAFCVSCIYPPLPAILPSSLLLPPAVEFAYNIYVYFSHLLFKVQCILRTVLDLYVYLVLCVATSTHEWNDKLFEKFFFLTFLLMFYVLASYFVYFFRLFITCAWIRWRVFEVDDIRLTSEWTCLAFRGKYGSRLSVLAKLSAFIVSRGISQYIRSGEHWVQIQNEMFRSCVCVCVCASFLACHLGSAGATLYGWKSTCHPKAEKRHAQRRIIWHWRCAVS